MTPDVVANLYGGCIAAGLLVGGVVALVNSWRT